MNNFRVKLAEGIESEDRLLKRIIDKGGELIDRPLPNQCFTGYDLRVKNKFNREMTIEVKRDNKSNNNVYIEHSYKNQPSGILISEAEYYFIDKPALGKFFYIETIELKDWIEWYKEHNRLLSVTCLSGFTEGYLVPVSILKLVM
ncbi:hypothetical protein [Deinococcus yunweiensis]|uniref:hypothetical protein n=1 Tax=Deinococcus yunweiensis TaxID=367282 RepID=UPI00398F6544